MKLKAATAANIFTTLKYTFAIFTSLIVFSPPELELLPQPLLYMVKALSFSVVERPDLYFLSLWVVVASTSSIGYLFMASRGGANLFQARSTHRKAVPYVAVLVFGIPFVLFMISVLFKEKEARESIG